MLTTKHILTNKDLKCGDPPHVLRRCLREICRVRLEFYSILVYAYIFKQAPPCLGTSLSKRRYFWIEPCASARIQYNCNSYPNSYRSHFVTFGKSQCSNSTLETRKLPISWKLSMQANCLSHICHTVGLSTWFYLTILGLITRRSEVQILLPLQKQDPQFLTRNWGFLLF